MGLSKTAGNSSKSWLLKHAKTTKTKNQHQQTQQMKKKCSKKEEISTQKQNSYRLKDRIPTGLANASELHSLSFTFLFSGGGGGGES